MNADFASSIESNSLTKPTTITCCSKVNNNDSSSTSASIVTATKSIENYATNDSVNKIAKNNTLNTGKQTKVIFNKNQILQYQVKQQEDYHYNRHNNNKNDDAAVETSANQLNEASLASFNRISDPISTCLTASESSAIATTSTTGGATSFNSLIKRRSNSSSLKLCNTCHQEILAIEAIQYQQNQQLEGIELNFNSNSNSNSKKIFNNSADYLPSAQYCQKCVLNAQVNVNEFKRIESENNRLFDYQNNEEQYSRIEEEEDNYSNLFWKFISNLPKSITQRRKSSSSVLNQEVIGYLEKKQLERDRQKQQQENNSNNYSSVEQTIIIEPDELKDSYTSDQTSTRIDCEDSYSFNKKVNFIKKSQNHNDDKQSLTTRAITTTTMICSSGDKSISNDMAAAGSTTATKPPSQAINNSKPVAIVESVQLEERVASGCDRDSGREELLFIRGSQQQATASNELLNECNLSVNSKKQFKPNKQQNKLSIATTLTTRSSVSSLSSCILSGSSTSEVRLKWGKKMDFLLSIIGFAVDLANIWRFPYLVYKNGGGVFFIPYIIMLIFGGIPLFFLELCLGQFVKKGPITVWNKICPSMKGVGYCSILVSWYVSFYYNVLIAWSVYFIYRSVLSFGDKMPWEDCDNSWNSKTTCVSISQLKELCAVKNDTLEHCRKELFSTVNVTSPAAEFFVKELSQLDQSNGFDHMGYLRPELVVCLMIVYLLHFMSLFRGLETSGKVVWVTATAPYIILSILLIRGLFLPGAKMGIEYYLSPKLERLRDPQVWIDAAGQVFYSIGVGFGVHLTYASFNSHNNNCHRDCLMTSAVNAITSAYSGLVVFVYLGYMAQNLGIEIDKVASEGYSLIFEVYPEALTTLPFARFWSILFFIMLLTLGIDSAVSFSITSILTSIPFK